MKVFFSWSGTRSLYIAEALNWWIPNVLQPVAPFISTRDIPKGARGLSIIADNLEKTNIGIVCLTEENLEKPWILFESGALSKLTTASYVCTFVLDVDPNDIEPPLGQFQHTRFISGDLVRSKAEVRDLIQTINSVLGERSLLTPRLEAAFETWWPQLETRMAQMPQRKSDEHPVEKRSLDSKVDELLALMRDRPQGGNPSFPASPVSVQPKMPLTAKDRHAAKHLLRIMNSGIISPESLPSDVVDYLVKQGWAELYKSLGDHPRIMATGQGASVVQSYINSEQNRRTQ